ncbi:MAG: glycosyltransferase [Bacteroidaceae bacterium]|nr:glycosyltransferase [Bacteroidaceae bacterium]MBQ9293537.1 glycosyltransferase [Bacteroidaceae bacterium]
MKYSIVVPVYNRPDEVDELLQSLSRQTFRDMEVIIVEDGSLHPCEEVVRRYAGKLQLRYYTKENSGPGPTRNFGAEHSQGDFLIFLDSDCVIPPDFLKEVDAELTRKECDAWGGPDRAHESFTPVQKAINYSMTSFLTTGGIRGGKKQMDKKFYPRSFNLGVRRSLYRQLGGFSIMRFGEDIDLSIRIYESGATCRLFPEAWVWHKRRTDFRKFFKQVHNSGIARINLMKRHPGSLKFVHLLPMLFTLGTFACLLFAFMFLLLALLGLVGLWGMQKPGCTNGPMLCIIVGFGGMLLFLLPLLLFSLLVFIDSSIRNRSIKIGFLSIWASFIQLIGYGTGFLRAWWLRCVCRRNEELQAFKDNFYK